MILVIPEVPVGPNGPRGLFRMHWAARKKYCAKWRLLVLEAYRGGGGVAAGNIREMSRRSVTIVQYRRKIMDGDNLWSACKPILDAMVWCGLLADDSPAWCELTVCQKVIGMQKGREGQIRTEIEIT